MAKIDLVNQENKKVGTIDLSDDVFGVEVNYPLVHQVIKAQLAGYRRGTAKTKTKSEVRGGGRKPFKQKGTGNARQGSIRSPLNPKGGQTFGPVPRSYAERTPKEMVRGALRCALSDRLKAKRLLVVDEFKFDKPKTKAFNTILKNNFKVDKTLLIDVENENLYLSARNIRNTKFLLEGGVNVYDIVKHEWLLISKKAIETLQARLSQAS